MSIPTTGLAHIALRVTDLQRSKQFYTAVGFTLFHDSERFAFVSAGGVFFALIPGAEQTPAGDRFDPFRVGLDHLALKVAKDDLPALKQRLDAANVRNNGIEYDENSNADQITFYDPDGIAWEFYASDR